MAYRKVDEASLTAVADAIREKSGTSEGLTFPEGFVNAVAGIQAGGAKIQAGIFKRTSDFGYASKSLKHNLGTEPNWFAWCRKDFAESEKTEDSGGYYINAPSGDVVAGFYANGVSAIVKRYAAGTYRFLVFPNNKDKYNRYVLAMTSNNIYSGMGAFGNEDEMECFWIAAVV